MISLEKELRCLNMIELELFEIKSLDAYDSLAGRMGLLMSNANHDVLVAQLKDRLGLRCQKVLLERPYRDFDFSSVFSLFYVKKHFPPSRDCLRLHFWYELV